MFFPEKSRDHKFLFRPCETLSGIPFEFTLSAAIQEDLMHVGLLLTLTRFVSDSGLSRGRKKRKECFSFVSLLFSSYSAALVFPLN